MSMNRLRLWWYLRRSPIGKGHTYNSWAQFTEAKRPDDLTNRREPT